jgi:hypothetical protein
LAGHRQGQRQLCGSTSLSLVDQRPGRELGQVGPHRIPIQAAGQRDDEIGLLARGDLQVAQRLAGLDEHQFGRWHSWYRCTTLAMLALVFRPGSMTAAIAAAAPIPSPHSSAHQCSGTYRAVDPLPEQVRMTVVPRVLLDHMNQDPAQRELPAVLAPGDIQRRRGGDPLARGSAR